MNRFTIHSKSCNCSYYNFAYKTLKEFVNYLNKYSHWPLKNGDVIDNDTKQKSYTYNNGKLIPKPYH
jgi:hypothetical protein